MHRAGLGWTWGTGQADEYRVPDHGNRDDDPPTTRRKAAREAAIAADAQIREGWISTAWHCSLESTRPSE